MRGQRRPQAFRDGVISFTGCFLGPRSVVNLRDERSSEVVRRYAGSKMSTHDHARLVKNRRRFEIITLEITITLDDPFGHSGPIVFFACCKIGRLSPSDCQNLSPYKTPIFLLHMNYKHPCRILSAWALEAAGKPSTLGVDAIQTTISIVCIVDTSAQAHSFSLSIFLHARQQRNKP